MNAILCMFAVAPVWERGLKYHDIQLAVPGAGRSRLGAWIEIHLCLELSLEVIWSLPFGSVD